MDGHQEPAQGVNPAVETPEPGRACPHCRGANVERKTFNGRTLDVCPDCGMSEPTGPLVICPGCGSPDIERHKVNGKHVRVCAACWAANYAGQPGCV